MINVDVLDIFLGVVWGIWLVDCIFLCELKEVSTFFVDIPFAWLCVNIIKKKEQQSKPENPNNNKTFLERKFYQIVSFFYTVLTAFKRTVTSETEVNNCLPMHN